MPWDVDSLANPALWLHNSLSSLGYSRAGYRTGLASKFHGPINALTRWQSNTNASMSAWAGAGALCAAAAYGRRVGHRGGHRYLLYPASMRDTPVVPPDAMQGTSIHCAAVAQVVVQSVAEGCAVIRATAGAMKRSAANVDEPSVRRGTPSLRCDSFEFNVVCLVRDGQGVGYAGGLIELLLQIEEYTLGSAVMDARASSSLEPFGALLHRRVCGAATTSRKMHLYMLFKCAGCAGPNK
ncbi:hypothetical protein DFH09DRAFT_1077434 [Mycena vulgaris]|nr:hypothetical protein DFH09DRAFT_1077434 [Mycena vulgaris]